MKNDQSLSDSWQHDVPPASDMTFVLATLRRMERHCFHHGLMRLLCMGALGAVMMWLFWPVFAQWSLLLATLLQSISQSELWVGGLLVTVVAVLELRVFR